MRSCSDSFFFEETKKTNWRTAGGEAPAAGDQHHRNGGDGGDAMDMDLTDFDEQARRKLAEAAAQLAGDDGEQQKRAWNGIREVLVAAKRQRLGQSNG